MVITASASRWIYYWIVSRSYDANSQIPPSSDPLENKNSETGIEWIRDAQYQRNISSKSTERRKQSYEDHHRQNRVAQSVVISAGEPQSRRAAEPQSRGAAKPQGA